MAVNTRFTEDSMTDTQDSGTDTGQQGGAGADSDKGFTPITTPQQLDAFLKDRVARAEAKAAAKFADYNDLKAKAEQFDASKSEAEKANDRITKLEQELMDTKTSAIRARIQAKHGISDEDAELFLTATDEETLGKQAERLAAREADRKKNNNRVPREGRTPDQKSGDGKRDAKRAWLSTLRDD